MPCLAQKLDNFDNFDNGSVANAVHACDGGFGLDSRAVGVRGLSAAYLSSVSFIVLLIVNAIALLTV